MTDIRIVEVGPRDGLQNMAQAINVEVKQDYIRLLLEAGVRDLEVGVFVRPDLVPQMADSAKVFTGLTWPKDVLPYLLVPNQKGLSRAQKCGVKNIAVFVGASESFNQKNIGMSMDDSLKEVKEICAFAKGMKVRGYVSVVWGCPYEGSVDFSSVQKMVTGLLDAGCFEVSLGDTIGVARPSEVVSTLKELTKEIPLEKLAVHMHDTYGMALANVFAAIGQGIRTVDTASGGLGGCPFAPGATGNLGTEDVVYLAQSMGLDSGISLEAMVRASLYIYDALGLSHFASKTLQALTTRKT